mmetsp:Transcript_39693/g.73171  ORF Transcript_39693/g.73171 Transcript_39693/m.73171 type:complete len:85 (+) Transcript_39693:534-788(+)
MVAEVDTAVGTGATGPELEEAAAAAAAVEVRMVVADLVAVAGGAQGLIGAPATEGVSSSGRVPHRARRTDRSENHLPPLEFRLL